MTKKGLGAALGWRGLVADESREARLTFESLLGVVACSMVATQTDYFVVGNTHMIAILAPICACAMLFGTLPALVVGAISGAIELAHALLMPLDAYEMYFAGPVSSLLLFAFFGLFMGLLHAWAADHPWRSERGAVLGILAVCAVGSVVFTLLFAVSANLENVLIDVEVPRGVLDDFTDGEQIASQIFADFLLMAGACLALRAADRWRRSQKRERTLTNTFQGAFAVAILIAYLVTVSLGYTVVSAVCRQSAERQIESRLNYLTGQLSERDKLLDGIRRRTQLTETKMRELYETSVMGLAKSMPLGENGICAIADNDVIVSSNLPGYVGRSFVDVVGSGFAGGFDSSLYDSTRSTLWYMGRGQLGYIRVAEVGYVRISHVGRYQVMAAFPANEVFAYRPWLVAVTSLVFLVLFAVVYAQASFLLRRFVVNNINETNESLARITEGDLDETVRVNDPIEFDRLSSGINSTVDSLKEAIAAEAARIERDLITAKAIQESALPSVFPPFPEIDAFDVYARMDAAREVGGDFYDLFLVDDHTLFFLVADVSGKGIPASLFMMAAKTEVANNVQVGMDLDVAMGTANWHLCQANDAGMFVTIWAGLLDWQTGKLTYVNAGHNPPLLRRGRTWEWLRQRNGLILGMFDTARYRTSAITLEPGDQLFLYTDGVNEAFSANQELYGNDRLEAFLTNHAEMHPHALIDALRADLASWAEGAEQSDDITMLALEYGVPPEASGELTLPASLDRLDDVLEMLHAELAQRRCPITAQNQLDIAVEELFVNVCSYAYPGEGTSGDVRVSYVYDANPNTMTVCITDWGRPFNPLARTDPKAPKSIDEMSIGGLGIFMAKRSVDDISYSREGNANVITFKKIW